MRTPRCVLKRAVRRGAGALTLASLLPATAHAQTACTTIHVDTLTPYHMAAHVQNECDKAIKVKVRFVKNGRNQVPTMTLSMPPRGSYTFAYDGPGHTTLKTWNEQ